MERRRITCPGYAHLEEIDVEETPFGLILEGCSRFEPRCDVTCDADCARRLDKRARKMIDDRGERVLVIHAKATEVADMLKADLARDGLVVDVANADDDAIPPPEDYEAVVIGSPVWLGRPARSITRFVRRSRDRLASVPTFFVSLTRSGEVNLGRFERRVGWIPTLGLGLRRDTARKAPGFVHQLARLIGEEIPALELA